MKNKACGKCFAVIMLVGLILALCIKLESDKVFAGDLYNCQINPCYAHPVTGVIEDSGGAASYNTGQGMVAGTLATKGIFEVADDGNNYLTFRMFLYNYTSNHSFSVQNVGDSGWTPVSHTIVNHNSSQNNGTVDVKLWVPSENCVVRGTMHVDPMHRDVIFYFYPNNFSGETSGNLDIEAAGETGGSMTAAIESKVAEVEAKEEEEKGKKKELKNDITEEASPAVDDATSKKLNSSMGLSLSTAGDKSSDGEKKNTAIKTSFIGAGVLLLVIIVAGGIYYLRRKKLGGR